MANRYYRATLTWNLSSHGVAQNTYHFRHDALSADSDSLLRANVMAWMTGVYVTSGLRNVMHTSTQFSNGQLDEVTAQGNLVRHIGGFGDASLSGQSSGDSEPGIVAMSATGRTNEPRVKMGKRWPPCVDSGVIDGLYLNNVLTYMVAATTRWLSGYTVLGVPRYIAGTPSSRTGGWVDSNLTGLVWNIPGSQVTRKIGRGQ